MQDLVAKCARQYHTHLLILNVNEVPMRVASESVEPEKCELVTPTAPRPASACDSPWGQDTICQVKS